MKYTRVAVSKSGATEIYQGEDGSLIEVQYLKSGAVDVCPVSEISPSLTRRCTSPEARIIWEPEEPITEAVRFPAEV